MKRASNGAFFITRNVKNCIYLQFFDFFWRNPLPRLTCIDIFVPMMNFVTCATLNRRWWRGL